MTYRDRLDRAGRAMNERAYDAEPDDAAKLRLASAVYWRVAQAAKQRAPWTGRPREVERLLRLARSIAGSVAGFAAVDEVVYANGIAHETGA